MKSTSAGLNARPDDAVERIDESKTAKTAKTGKARKAARST